MHQSWAALEEWYATLRATLRPFYCREHIPPSESHIQALWFDKALRPKHLALADGTPIEVLEPGRWNLAAGPDFKDALISFGGVMRRGDVEIHLHPNDWDAHAHANDPAYAHLILHVVWFAAPPAKTLPASLPQLILQPFAEAQTPYPFETVTPAHYPYTDALLRPCKARLDATPGERERLLLAAGLFRLRVKSKTLVERIHSDGAEQALYAGILTAMGYGKNAPLFTRLAKELPFERLRDKSPLERFALLAGTAGLLKPDQRDLWDLYWNAGGTPTLTPYTWDLSGCRPQNHPYRRCAGAIGILQTAHTLTEGSLNKLPKRIAEASTLLAKPLHLPGTPIGISRATALVINLIAPYRLAQNALVQAELEALPPENISAPMREVWLRLTGDATLPLPKDGLRLQGLLQLHTDFCANPHLLCTLCPLAR